MVLAGLHAEITQVFCGAHQRADHVVVALDGRRDEGALGALADQQTFRHQLAVGAMHHQPADLQLLGQAQLAGQHVPRFQRAAGDQRLERFLDLVIIGDG